jgi:hypothetical protein
LLNLDKGEGTPQTAYLLSQWVNSGTDVKFRFKLKTTNEDLVIKIVTYDEDMKDNIIQVIEKPEVLSSKLKLRNLIDLSYIYQEINVIIIEKMDKNFRIGFSIETKFSKSLDFTLSSIDLGDPCVEDSTDYNTCSGGNGTCIRELDNNQWISKCDCKHEYTGEKCQVFNYCNYNHVVSPHLPFP